MQTEGGEEDTTESGDPTYDDKMELEEDSVNETSPAGRNTENVE